MSAERAPRGIDPSKPHPARRYNYWLGGKDNFQADRVSGEAVASGFPTIRHAAIENRRFMQRAVRYLAEEEGIRQFLDVGTGLPSAGNVHEIAQEIDPASRIVYVDNDPIVLVHARALLTSSPEGATAYLDSDLREPRRILADPALHKTLDLTEPVALMLVAITHFLTDEDDAYGTVRTLVDALAPGSFVVITNATQDHLTPEERAAVDEANQRSGIPFRNRSADEVARFFDGLDLLAPGVGSVIDWRPDPARDDHAPTVKQVSMHGAVARVP
ncbi:SAM-dependent methyltransferase [Actinomadura harenae]|uniref:SAM-dependent methyltransferase n=1 Tax=Actinomadura harenae TaxID=2483351 RepID=UPI001F2F905A|nr:SAM-dependent methyltransferase [Actinomadura harenae]